ncbi:hypothetical protein P2318_32975 [Myxococcaceae bacterium GXIMD 01537]
MNRAWVEPPDLLWAHFRGALDMESAQASVSIYREQGEQQPFYLLADIAASRHTPEARKYIVEHSRPEWFLGIVYIGASLEQQAVTTGFMLALLKGKRTPYEVAYVKTAAEALEWVAQHRARRQLRAP